MVVTRRRIGVARGLLDVVMAEIRLQGARVSEPWLAS
jgi:hypothetical protein